MLFLATSLRAQSGDASSTSRGPAAPAPGVIANEVVIKLEKFGTGNVARAGDWAGIRVSVNDATTKQRTVLVRLSCEDTDGDTPVYQRELTTNPGTDQPVWLYGRIPYGFSAGGGTVVVSVFEAIESGGGDNITGGTAFRAGRLLGQMPINPNGGSVFDFRCEVMGVVSDGNRNLGLEKYMQGDPNAKFVHVYGNEQAEIAAGLKPTDLPDRWMGLAMFDVILWGQGKPEELRGERARAMREWIERGGHLVIVLPAAGQTWTTASANELYDVMPMVAISRSEAEPLKGFRSLFVRPVAPGGFDQFPTTGTVHFFQPLAEAEPNQAMKILNGPDGRCVVARRLVGSGAVTLVGIDLNATAFSQYHQVDADIFWHRVLGRRGDLTSAPPQTSPSSSGQMPQRDHIVYDEFLGPAINQTGRSAAGVLLGFVVFVLYWLVAGPGGFAILKRRTQHHHAWLFFVIAGAAFTGLAWTGASLLRPRRIDCRHITFIDHVYGQPTDRARVWGSVLVPWYGEATLSIGEPGSRGNNDPHHSLNALSAWDPQEDSLGIGSSFPDSRAYYMDARQPDSMTFPSRSTVKQFRADWAGGPRWPMPFPVNADGSPGKLELLRTSAAGDASTPAVRGTLVNKLPKTLTDIAVIVIPRQRTVSALGTSSPPASAEVYYPNPPLIWKPDETLDLERLTSLEGSQTSLAGRRFENWVATLLPRTNSISTGMASGPSADIALNGLAFFSMLPPAERAANTNLPAATRKHSHGWDLGRWFTQPCVIVIARLVDAETPVPLMIDGKPFPSTGTTVVRWIYPFPDNPPDLAATADADKTKP